MNTKRLSIPSGSPPETLLGVGKGVEVGSIIQFLFQSKTTLPFLIIGDDGVGDGVSKRPYQQNWDRGTFSRRTVADDT